jgi:hypothetical protein
MTREHSRKPSAERFAMRCARAVPIAAALTLAAAAPGAHAATPVVGVQIDAGPKRVGGRIVTSTMHLHVTYATDPPGAQLFTVQQAVILFPDSTYGRFFPSCNAAQITRFYGDTRRCPKGSQVGSGSLTAQVVPAGIAAAGRVKLFNSHHGRSITFNIQTTKPAVINESFDAPFTRLPGKYPMKLVMDIPSSLQEVLPGLFVGLQTFDVTISAVTKVHGARHHYLPIVCPKHGLHAEFGLLDSTTGQSSTVATDAELHCKDLSR